MIKEITAQGKDIIEAKENARAALGAGPLDDVNFEIIHAGSKGIFGIIGVKPAQVRAYMEIPEAEEPELCKYCCLITSSPKSKPLNISENTSS